MKAQDRRQELAQRASAFGWSLSEDQVDRMLAYLDGVLRENARVNLTRVTDPSEAIERHLLDSLAIGLTLNPDEREDSAGDLLDLGTGGGFPGVPAAIALPNWRAPIGEGNRLHVPKRTQMPCCFWQMIFGLNV